MHSILTLIVTAGLVTAQTNTNLQTKFPTATSTTGIPAARTIAAGTSFDGQMLQWDRSPSTCKDQTEGGEKDALFVLENGATLSNVIVGPGAGEGIYCKGSCTLNNVWWTDVCEDAATFLQSSGTSYVNGGGARNAADKVFQHNGGGTVSVKNFLSSKNGKIYRSCGNCKTQVARKSIFENIRAIDSLSVVAGVNANFGDSTTIKNSCLLKGRTCDIFEGNNSGKEPTKIGTGPSGTACVVRAVQTSGC
uniref:Pectate lyase n=1 Tax=Humicola insolens TaxID=85995 RepID=A0A5C0BBP1_HUMIN|nr:pectate lyase [Humicola insolens]